MAHDSFRTTTPVSVIGIGTATAISASRYFSCARLSDGTVKCWGRNSKGQLGDGSTIQRTTPVAVTGLSQAIGVSVGRSGTGGHTCALLSDGSIKCWGDNTYGQLGNGATGAGAVTVPVLVSGLSNAVAVSAGGPSSSGTGGHSCAVLSDGTARCWGRNNFSQLGMIGSDSSTPVTAGASNGVESAAGLAVGGTHSCLLRSDGKVKCWGGIDGGILGDGTYWGWRTSTVTVTGLTDVASIGAGYYHTCAIQADGGTAKCWGSNSEGQLGDTTTTDRATPTLVSGLANAVAIQGGVSHTCALVMSDGGTVKCWGDNSYGALGNDAGTTDSTVPVSVLGLTNVKSLAVGGYHACALVASDGGVPWCWGFNMFGQLGDGTTAGKSSPVAVTGVTNASGVAAGDLHSCALIGDGTVKCWGFNYYGQVGDNSTTTPRSTPTLVLGIDAGTAVGVWAGGAHSCALLGDGTAKCWGYNANGQLGDGTTTQRLIATAVGSLSGVVRMALGGSGDNVRDHTCAQLADGTVRCFGANFFGQIGDGTYAGKLTPTSLYEFP